jgi:hypothetical protein
LQPGLTGQHVRDHGDRMEWIFSPQEAKTSLRFVFWHSLILASLVSKAGLQLSKLQIIEFELGETLSTLLPHRSIAYGIQAKILVRDIQRLLNSRVNQKDWCSL